MHSRYGGNQLIFFDDREEFVESITQKVGIDTYPPNMTIIGHYFNSDKLYFSNRFINPSQVSKITTPPIVSQKDFQLDTEYEYSIEITSKLLLSDNEVDINLIINNIIIRNRDRYYSIRIPFIINVSESHTVLGVFTYLNPKHEDYNYISVLNTGYVFMEVTDMNITDDSISNKLFSKQFIKDINSLFNNNDETKKAIITQIYSKIKTSQEILETINEHRQK